MSDNRDLRSLPKAHLHLHLEGAMRRETLLDLCDRYDITPPADTRGQRFDNFGGFNQLYWAACECIRSRGDLARLVLEVAEDAAAQGAIWIEPAFDAVRYSVLRQDSLHRLFENQEVGWRFILDAAATASRATGVGIAFISAIDRTRPLTDALERARITANLVRADAHYVQSGMKCFDGQYAGIVAVGLHGNEEGFPPGPFAEAFRVATSDTNLLSTPHAGEIAPSAGAGADSVADAIDHLGADRILHGVLAATDPALVERLARENICLDVCPSSNLQLSVFSSVDAHPLPELLAAGVPCTLASDDPLLFGPDLVDEFELCRRHMGLSDQQLAALARNSFTYSGAPDKVKSAGLNAVDDWLNATGSGC
jgi:adenosine deaminase